MASVPPDPPPSGAPNGKTPQFAGFCFAAAFSGSVADADHVRGAWRPAFTARYARWVTNILTTAD
jgi:hypothetical protein